MTMGANSAWASEKGKCCLQSTSLLTFCTTWRGFDFQCHLTLLRHLAITLQLPVGSSLRSGCFMAPLSALGFLSRKGTAQGVAHYSLTSCPVSVTTRCQLLLFWSHRSWAGLSEGEKAFHRLAQSVFTSATLETFPSDSGRRSNSSRLRNPLEISNKSNPLFSGKTSVDYHVECSSVKENQDMHHRWLQPRWRLRLGSC